MAVQQNKAALEQLHDQFRGLVVSVLPEVGSSIPGRVIPKTVNKGPNVCLFGTLRYGEK